MTTATAPVSQDQIEELLLAGDGLRTVAGLSGQQVETLYSYGHQFYEQSKYEEAELFFSTACFMDHKNDDYWMALGAARQAAGWYEEALTAYQQVAECDEIHPMFAIRVAECFLAMGELENAVQAVYYAVDLADET
ncbi:MAG: tetratricopeptide repeat protein, partial [Planctomycetota bacterium]